MKKLFFILILIPVFAFAQPQLDKIKPPINNCSTKGLNFNEPFFITENKTSPFLYNQWEEGYLIINDSIISSQKKMHFNLETGELIIGSETGKSVVLSGESLTGFVINENGENSRRIFTKINKEDFEKSDITRSFYEMILNEEGTDYMIKDVKKYVLGLDKNKGSQSHLSIEYKKKISYYIKNDFGKYIETKLNKRNVLKVLEGKNAEIKAFATSNKINFNKENDVLKVLDYYHTL